MKAGRSSVFRLMGLVVAVAVTLEALRSPTDLWRAAFANGAALLLIGATIQARFAPDRGRRDWCFGFALFGWSYLLLVVSPIRQKLALHWINEEAIRGVMALYQPHPRDENYTSALHEFNNAYYWNAIPICHAVTCLVFAYLGAQGVAFLARRSGRREES